MRLVPLLSAISTLGLLVACNAILGNEDDYELVSGDAGQAGTTRGGTAGGNASGGKGGATAGAAGSGGKSTGKGGKGGSSASGGSAGKGSAGRGGESGNDEGGSSGTTAGAGEGGSPPTSCEPTGPEDCFNGRDDDCNDAIDCADSACDGPAECRPATAGADLGYFAALGDTCPQGYTTFTRHQNLQASYECLGCSCTAPQSRCESGVYGYGPYECSGFQFDGALANVFSTSCELLPADANLHHYPVRGFSTCTPAGTPTLPDATWEQSMLFCQLDDVGGGCGSGERCLPVETGDLCTLTDNDAACPADFPNDHGTWHDDFTDSRECTPCSCSFGGADCPGAFIEAYEGVNCTGNVVALGNGEEGSACPLSITPRSGRVSVVGGPSNGSCAPNNSASGEALPVGPHKACCFN